MKYLKNIYTLSYLKAFGMGTQHGSIGGYDKQGTHRVIMGYIKGTSWVFVGLSTGYLLGYILGDHRIMTGYLQRYIN